MISKLISQKISTGWLKTGPSSATSLVTPDVQQPAVVWPAPHPVSMIVDSSEQEQFCVQQLILQGALHKF